MADIDDNPKDLTLAEAISYLAFDCLLAKEDLAARQEVHSDRSKAQSAMVSEILDSMLPGEGLPKGLKPEEEKKRTEELKQEEARKTRLFGGAKLDWIYSRKGDWPAFTPDDAAKIDDACNRLVRWMIDEKVTGTGRLKKDDELNDECQNIPSGFLRSGVHVNPLSDSIDEDILLPGNFGRPLKGYRYVQINRAELVADKRAEKPLRASASFFISSFKMASSAFARLPPYFLKILASLSKKPASGRSSGGYSDQALRTWYKKMVAENLEAGKIPTREDDWKAAKNAVSENVPRDAVRALRNELAPKTWTAQGRRKSTN